MAKRRANGKGNLRKRKDGRWEGRYTAGHDPETGKAIYRNVLGRTQAEARAKLKQAIEEAKHVDPVRSKQYTIPRVRFHDLRHTFATLALQNGVDVKTVSGMLGHYSAGFTLDTYAHITTSAQRQAAKAMEHVLSSSL